MSRVNVDVEAFTDIRFKLLGKQIGASENEVLGCMTRVWWHCTDKQTHFITQEIFEAIVSTERFFDAALNVDLLRRAQDKIYVCGTRGRIEWLGTLRRNAKKGGQAFKRKMKPKHDVKETEEQRPHGLPGGPLDGQAEMGSLGGPPAPAPAPILNNTYTSNHRRKKKSKNLYPEEFETIYKSYPRREGKTQGFRVYEKEISSLDDLKQLTAAISNYRLAKAGTEHKYLLHFKTFMNQWRDWLEVTSPPDGTPPPRERTVDEILGVAP